MHYQVGGTILGGEVAMIYGWCISIAGGMHHASSDQGGGCKILNLIEFRV